jgi:hypothetical protein
MTRQDQGETEKRFDDNSFEVNRATRVEAIGGAFAAGAARGAGGAIGGGGDGGGGGAAATVGGGVAGGVVAVPGTVALTLKLSNADAELVVTALDPADYRLWFDCLTKCIADKEEAHQRMLRKARPTLSY